MGGHPVGNYKYYDFFAGGGMAGCGLGSSWTCLFANDIDERKAEVYRANHASARVLHLGDVNDVRPIQLPDHADLAWASFPCQDLSLAGNGAGLVGNRSGTFWGFWKLMQALHSENRAPRLIVLENVFGALTSHGGRDFAAIANAIAGLGYRFGAVVIDAVHFVPQSRPRLFIVAASTGLKLPQELQSEIPSKSWHPPTLLRAKSLLCDATSANWIWWNIPSPPPKNENLSSIINDDAIGASWHSPEETRYILALMSERNLQKVEAAKRTGRRMVGTIYRRTRPDGNGGKKQRAEVRFDDIAGCLRTPAGGSSRQTILTVEGDRVRSRLISPREAAQLMGLPQEYKLPARYNDAYHLIGDGVAVPVVRHLAHHVFEPLLSENRMRAAA